MAQKEIEFNAALMSLPLQADPARLARCDCRDDRQSWDIDGRVLIEVPSHYQPGFFFVRKADNDSAKFNVSIYNATTKALVKTLASAQLASVSVYRQMAQVTGGVSWDTVIVPAQTNLSLNLTPGVYYLRVAGLTSELFRVVSYEFGDDVPSIDHLLFTLGNAHGLVQIPYQTGYTQVFGLPGNLCVGEVKTIVVGEKSDQFGTKVTFYRQYRVWTLDYAEVSEPLSALLKSFEILDTVLVRDNHKVISLTGSDISVSLKEDSCCTLSASLTFNEVLSEWKSCESGVPLIAQTGLASAQIGYIDPADSDSSPEAYQPPVVSSQPVTPSANPLAGTILNEASLTHDCGDPFVFNGVNYATQRTLTKADGNGGSTQEVSYEDICNVNPILVPVPTLPGLLAGLTLRVGQAVNAKLIPDGLFGPAAGHSALPTISVTNLPAGTSYAGGRVVGNPTTPGDVTATVTVTQPGGGSVSAPVTISTLPAAQTLLDSDLTVSYSYKPSSQTLAVLIECSFVPQLKGVGLQLNDGDFVTGSLTDITDTYTVIFPGVLQSGRLLVRQLGSTSSGLSFPVNLDTASANTSNTGTGTTTPAVIPGLRQVTTQDGITEHSIIFNNNSNPIISLASYSAQGGVYLFAPNADGSFSLVGSFLNNAEGEVTLNNGVWGRYFNLGKKDAFLNTERLLMPNTSVELSTLLRTQFPVAAGESKGLWGPETNPLTGKTTDVLFDAKKLFSYLRAEADDWARSNNFGERASSPGPVGTIYCRPTPAAPTTTGNGITETFISVASAQFGVEQTHGLNVAGSRIWPDMQTVDFQDARAYIKLEFPTNNTFKVTARNPETAADSSFSVNLNLRVKPQ